MLLSAGLRRARHVLAILAGSTIALLGCTTYEGLPLPQPTEASSGGDHERDAPTGGCNSSATTPCDSGDPRPDASISDVSRSDADDAFDGAPWDQADADRSSDAPRETGDGVGPADSSNTPDASDGDIDAADAGADTTNTDDAGDGDGDGDGGSLDAGDAEPDTPDASDAPSVDVTDVVQPPTLYRAINIGGSDATALVIDGQNWEAGLTAPNVTYSVGTDAAGSGGLARVTNVPLIPPTDANRTSMIQTFAWGRPVAFTMSSVPAGRYLVYMYTWEDNGAQTFDILLQGQVVLSNYNSGADGHWERLGPWTVDVTAGTIVLSSRPTTGPAFANFCGVEVWRQ